MDRVIPEARTGSLAKVRSTDFLELQMLVTKKEFLEMQLDKLEKNKKLILKKLEYICKSMEKIAAEVNIDALNPNGPKKPDKKYGVQVEIIKY